MKKASLVYWLYCKINKIFGSRAIIKRDPLRFIYGEIHRYSVTIELNGTATNAQAKNILVQMLINDGFVLEDGRYYTKRGARRNVTIHFQNYEDNILGISCFFR